MLGDEGSGTCTINIHVTLGQTVSSKILVTRPITVEGGVTC